MNTHDESFRTPFAEQTLESDKRRAGRTESAETQLELIAAHELEPGLHEWVHDRLGRHLGKFAPQIERMYVRFGDDNGPRGGIDKNCLIQVSLSKLPQVVVEMRGKTDREAFDLAAGRAERATRRTLDKHGYSTKHEKVEHGLPEVEGLETEAEGDEGEGIGEGSLMGRRVGHGNEELLRLAERPAKERGDQPVDTAQAGTSADDRKVGDGHTGRRNTKLNDAGMAYSLEDSTGDRPSRKSSRGGAPGLKSDNPLTQRTKSAVQSPQQRAERHQARKI